MSHSSPENADALPCPFCGGTTKTRLYGGDGLFFIRCQTCPAEMRGFDQCAQDAIDAWNMRSFHHAQGAANPFPCPYNIDGCVLENSEIGPCLCALTSPGCGEVDPTRPACGQGDEHGRKPTEKGYGHD